MIKQAKSKDKQKWNKFVAHTNLGSFLQSWEWGEFQKSLDRKIFRLIIINKGKLVGVALIVKHKLPGNKSYLYAPRGPVFGTRNWSLKIGQDLLTKISQIAIKEKAIFLKIEPKEILKPDFKAPRGFKKSQQVQPQITQIINLQQSEDDLLKQMHYKTRYNIKLAKRKGVKIKISTKPKDIDLFYELLKETTKREKFSAFQKIYYKKFLENLGRSKIAKLFLAEYQGKIISAIIITFFGSESCYVHGASSYQFRNLMAPHLLQWEAILQAKKQGIKWYDMWGVALKEQTRHKWAGISRFKRGFGGKEIHYPGGLDYVYNPYWYAGYKIISNLKRTT